jgi:hypothetical protein
VVHNGNAGPLSAKLNLRVYKLKLTEELADLTDSFLSEEIKTIRGKEIELGKNVCKDSGVSMY